MKKLILISALIITLLASSGCWLMFDFICPALGDDSAHCVQWMAVQDENPDGCDNVPLKKDFEGTGSNPPKDKCYLMVAEKSGDPSPCDRIQGGMYSYTVEECYLNTAATHSNPDLCKDAPNEVECRSSYASHPSGNGNCGTGFEFNSAGGICVKSEKKSDDDDDKDKDNSECAKDEIWEKCSGSHELTLCNEGKLSKKVCPNGCFEAACRTSPGKTDIENEEEFETKSDKESEESDKTDSEEKEDDKEDDEDKDKSECKNDDDCDLFQECKSGVCVDMPDCESKDDCLEDENCVKGECVPDPNYEKGCKKDSECGDGEECNDGICVKNAECFGQTEYCGTGDILVSCEKGKLVKFKCNYGCANNKCLTEKEGKKEDEKKEEESKCDDSYSSCISEVRLEFCVDGKKSQGFCEWGCEKGSCLAREEETEEEEEPCAWWNPFCSDDAKENAAKDAGELKDMVSGKYMDALDAEIDREKNPAKLEGLKKYKEFLEQAGDTIDGVQTSLETLNSMKRIFIDQYDPSMDIENMKVDQILRKSFSERVSDSLDKLKFWKGDKSPEMVEQDTALDQLKVYKAMLERQQEIDFLKQNRKDRLVGTLVEGAKSKAVDTLKEKATDLAEGIAGDAFITVGIAGKAIDAVKDGAEEMMFTGLIKAYNRRRADLEERYPDLDDKDIHKMAVKQVESDPYQDSKAFTRIAQYGNLLENADCKDSSNPLCIDRNVFWTSMDKSYEHVNHNKLFKRSMDQLDAKIKKSKGEI